MELRNREQSCEVRAPDLLWFRWSGVVEADDVTALFEQVKSACADWPNIFAVFDMGKVHLLPGDARRRFLEHIAKLPIRATAFTRTEFPLRVIATMIMSAAGVEGGKGEYEFFESESEALAWLDTIRRGLSETAPAVAPAIG